MLEYKGSIKNLKVAYFGDCYNNVTYDLMRAITIMGGEIRVSCPADKAYEPDPSVVEEVLSYCKISGGKYSCIHDPKEAAKDVDVLYTDSW